MVCYQSRLVRCSLVTVTVPSKRRPHSLMSAYMRVELLRCCLTGVHPAGWRSEHAQVRAFGFAVSLYEGIGLLHSILTNEE